MASTSASPTALTSAPESSLDTHLSYPADAAAQASSPPSQQPRPVLRERLYVGNLHPSIDEYTLLQVFAKFGKVSRLDYLFHKTGPMKGKPRGYAFVEYADPNDAQKALETANNKLFRGRKLVITHAHQAPLDQANGAGARYKRSLTEASKPTTLSLLKSAATGRSDATEAKIAKMEAKLRQMGQSQSGATSSLHPSLPPRPVSFPSSIPTDSSVPRQTLSSTTSHKRNQRPLPSLPLSNPAKLSPSASMFPHVSTSASGGSSKEAQRVFGRGADSQEEESVITCIS